MIVRLVVSVCLLLLPLSVPAQTPPDYHGAGDLAPLQDTALREQLRDAVCALDLCPLIASDDLAIALVILAPQGEQRLAMFNGHRMMYAASLPKVAILLGAMVASERGELEIDAALADDLEQMIRTSCNPCATRALDAVGRERLLGILREPAYDFYDETRSGGLWVGKDYADRDAYRRDPVANLSHGATAYQVARLYYRLQAGTLLGSRHTAMMLQAMARPSINHKFVAGLSDWPELSLWRKSGTWRTYHADSALVRGAEVDYIIVAMVDSADGEEILRSLANRVHLTAQRAGAAP